MEEKIDFSIDVDNNMLNNIHIRATQNVMKIISKYTVFSLIALKFNRYFCSGDKAKWHLQVVSIL